jgi:hydroxymethylpyrimidine pyrophosphatase-like HAD family hydrolase
MPGTLPLRRFDLVLCDIDGCLVSEGQHAFDVPALTKVAEHNALAMQRGDRPLVTVCTGRPQPFAESICRLIGNLFVPCVCEMGAWIYHPGTNVYTLDPRITPGNLEAVASLSSFCRQTFGPLGVTQQPGKAASVTLFHPNTGFLRETVFPAVREHIAAARMPFRVSMTWLYINCDLEHISKGTGLDRLLSELKIPKARLAGIGDTTSDQCIAERVAFFACPSNAQPAIKEHAHLIAKAPEAQGVVEILSHLVGDGV